MGALTYAAAGLGPIGAQPAPPGPRLADFWEIWLDRTGPLLSEEERLYFRILEDDRAREKFLGAFWKSRGPEALERWRRNGEDARRLRSRARSRARAVRLVGKPGSIETIQRCGALRRLEIWEWQPWHLELQNARVSEPQYLVFVESTTLERSSFEPWIPGDVEGLARGPIAYGTLESLLDALGATTCIDGGALARLATALERAVSFEELGRIAAWPTPSPGWLGRLRDPARPAAAAPAATLELSYPGAFTRYTILHGEIEVPVARLTRLVPGQILDRVTVTGDVFRGGRLADTFEIVHHIAGAAPGERIVLDLYRRLRPGPHRLLIRVADRHGIALLREELEIDVPAMEEPAPRAGRSLRGSGAIDSRRSRPARHLPERRIAAAHDERSRTDGGARDHHRWADRLGRVSARR